MHARPGYFWNARATHAAMPHLPVPPPCRRTTHFSDCTSPRLSPLASPLAQGRGSGGAENASSVLRKHDSVWFDRIRGGLAPHKMAPSI
jgi:hypothetical protein